MIIMMIEFFKIGLFAIGGGLATIPFLYDLSARYNWFTIEELTMMVAVSESTPGPIGINMSTYVGVHTFGIFGGLLASLSLVAPSVIIICLLARGMSKVQNHGQIQIVFKSLKVAVLALISSVAIQIMTQFLWINEEVTQSSFRWETFVLFIVLITLYQKLKVHPICLIIGSGIMGVVFGL